MMTKHFKIVLSISSAAIAIILLLIFAISKESKPVNLTDIENMNIGSEMPKILYADDNTTVLSGAFGIIEFDIADKRIHTRISFEKIEKLNLDMPSFSVSEDGKWIFITDSQTDVKYKCRLGTDRIRIAEEAPPKLFSPVFINQYEEKYDEWFDSNYLISETIVIKNETYLYLRANPDWSMNSLQLTECDLKTNKEILSIDIFNT